MSQRVSSENAGKNEDSEAGAAPGAAVDAENEPIPAELAAVIEAWPTLPEAIRAGILAMVKAAR